jgi:pyridoxamine 5'-phosphate oxidase family protein
MEQTMEVFTTAELKYLKAAQGLARLATVGADGTPHVTPVGWSLSTDRQAIEVGGRNFATTKKYRDVARSGRAALVIDEVLPPWRPQGIEIRGPAEAITAPEPRIRLTPQRLVGWGFEGATGARRIDVRPAPSMSGRPTERPSDSPYALVRQITYDPAALTRAAAQLEEFQRIHVAQPGYRGNVVIETENNTRYTLTLWSSEQHAADARTVLEPTVRRLLGPLMTKPAQLIAAGAVVETDLHLSRRPISGQP